MRCLQMYYFNRNIYDLSSKKLKNKCDLFESVQGND